MLAWNLTAQTILHVDEWKAFFARGGLHAATTTGSSRESPEQISVAPTTLLARR